MIFYLFTSLIDHRPSLRLKVDRKTSVHNSDSKIESPEFLPGNLTTEAETGPESLSVSLGMLQFQLPFLAKIYSDMTAWKCSWKILPVPYLSSAKAPLPKTQLQFIYLSKKLIHSLPAGLSEVARKVKTIQ